MTANPLTSEQLKSYSNAAPVNAHVLLRHVEDGRIFAAVRFERGSGFWYPDGRVSKLEGIFDDVELIAYRHAGEIEFKPVQPKIDVPPKPVPARLAAVAKAQQTLSKRNVTPEPVKQEVVFDSTMKTAHKVTVTEVKKQVIEDDFVSIKQLQDEAKVKVYPVFLSIRNRGQIVFPMGLMQIIGDKFFDLQISKKNRKLRLIVGAGEIKVSKSGKMNCIPMAKIIHEVQGRKGDIMRENLGRVKLEKVSDNVYEGEF